MTVVHILSVDFECAGRKDFIDECYALVDKSATIYERHPQIYRSEHALMLNMNHSAMVKLNDLVLRVPLGYRAASPDRWERYNVLQAGVVIHERLRQVREWLGVYDSYGKHPISGEDIAAFPALNVRHKISPALYDGIVDVAQSSRDVAAALTVSDEAFMMAKNRMRHLKENAPSV